MRALSHSIKENRTILASAVFLRLYVAYRSLYELYNGLVGITFSL